MFYMWTRYRVHRSRDGIWMLYRFYPLFAAQLIIPSDSLYYTLYYAPFLRALLKFRGSNDISEACDLSHHLSMGKVR